MQDAFLVFAYHVEPFASEVADTLAMRGLTLGPQLLLWPGMRLLPLVDQGLVDARHAVVVVSRDFLAFAYRRKDLDGLAGRRKVVPLLYGVEESQVAEWSPRLAVAAIPGAMAEQVVRLLRA